METTFKLISNGWNADPNAPRPSVSVDETTVTLRFYLNAFQFPEFKRGDIGEIIFKNCWRYRLGSTNDEGWYMGHCRFSKKAPAWGKFYEVGGDIMDDFPSLKWSVLSAPSQPPSRHFLFYLRDETFECDATEFALSMPVPRAIR